MDLKEIFQPTTAKTLTWISLFIAPVKAIMVAVSVMVIVDLFTGLWAAIKRKELITSTGIKRTVSKTLAYQLAIVTSFIMEKYFLVGIPVVKVVAGLIATTEFKSVLENLSSITKIDFLHAIVEKFQGTKIKPTYAKKKVKKQKKKISTRK